MDTIIAFFLAHPTLATFLTVITLSSAYILVRSVQIAILNRRIRSLDRRIAAIQ